MLHRLRSTTLVLGLCTALTVTLGGCARPATSAGGASSNRATLTQEQLAATNSETLYDAITKLRPDWLNSRGPTSVTDATPTSVSVYMSGSFLGKAESLREMRILDVTQLRYWNAAQASARFGMGHPRGVIEVVRR